MVQFPDGLGGDRIVERIFTGPLGRQLRDALGYIRNVVLEERVQKYPDRAEADRWWNYPYVAIEEALVNAVYHRSYEIREPIEVRVLPDHLTVSSFPGPDRSINVAQLKAGTFITRRYRNRRIGEFLKELKLTEGRGTGVPKIVQAMRANGSPAPRFKTDRDRTYFVTLLPIHPRSRPEADVGSHARSHAGSHDLPTAEDAGHVAGHVSARQRALLAFCLTPRDRTEIAEHLGLFGRDNLRTRYLVPLLAEGLIEMTLPATPRARQQRYRTTGLGMAALDRAR